MFRGIIFDLDGVVADTHSIHLEAWRQLLAETGRHASPGQLDFVREGRKREDILRNFFGALSAKAIQRYGKRKDELFFGAMLDLRAITGVLEFLGELEKAGVPKALATSAGVRRTREILERLGLSGHFCAVVTGDDVVNGKPDPAVFLLAAERLNIAPRHLLVLEDSPAGVRAARSAGMKCLGIASGARAAKLRREGADYVIANFSGFSVARLEALFMVDQKPSAAAAVVAAELPAD